MTYHPSTTRRAPYEQLHDDALEYLVEVFGADLWRTLRDAPPVHAADQLYELVGADPKRLGAALAVLDRLEKWAAVAGDFDPETEYQHGLLVGVRVAADDVRRILRGDDTWLDGDDRSEGAKRVDRALALLDVVEAALAADHDVDISRPGGDGEILLMLIGPDTTRDKAPLRAWATPGDLGDVCRRLLVRLKDGEP